VLENYEDGYLSRAERDEKIYKLDAEFARLEAATAPVRVDPETLTRAIVRTFAGFRRLPFARQRDLLRATVREVIVEKNAITGLTLVGTMPDDDGVKSCKPSRSRCSPRCRELGLKIAALTAIAILSLVSHSR
jgi:hypothetical protein